MADTLIKKIERIQADMCVIEGMVCAVIENAYKGTGTGYIGNSLEVLKEYIEKRTEELDLLGLPFRMINNGKDAITGKALTDECTYWEKYMADGGRDMMLSKEASFVHDKIAMYLDKLPGNHKDLLLMAEELGAVCRKQGFAEGMAVVTGMICGEEDSDGQSTL